MKQLLCFTILCTGFYTSLHGLTLSKLEKVYHQFKDELVLLSDQELTNLVCTIVEQAEHAHQKELLPAPLLHCYQNIKDNKKVGSASLRQALASFLDMISKNRTVCADSEEDDNA